MDELDAIDENDMKREEAESARRQKEQLRQESAAQAIEQRRSQAQSDLRDILSDMENLHEAYNRDSEKLHKTELAKARIEGDQKNLQNRIWDTYKLTYAGAEEFRRTPFDEKESDRRAAELQGQIRALGFEGAQDVLLLCLNTQGMLLAEGKGRTQVQTHQALPPQKVVW
mgnify:FL=1